MMRDRLEAENSSFLMQHHYPGRLITAEGLDGSGKSTQLHLLSFWLRAEGHEVIITEWNSSKLIKRALKASRKLGSPDPKLLSLLHAADIAEIHQREIQPALQRGAIVLADRYIYTALARDQARGVDLEWAQEVYQFAACPDLSIYFQLNVEEAQQRSLSANMQAKYTHPTQAESTLHTDATRAFYTFQQQVLQAYESMIDTFGLVRLDATLPIKQQQLLLRDTIQHVLPAD